MLDDPDLLTDEIKQAARVQMCSLCPKRGTGITCHVIRPIVAVFDRVDSYPSTTPVTAIYVSREKGTGRMAVAETTLQRALQYVSLLSLMYYRELGRQYWRYFWGVNPLTPVDDV